MKFTQGTLTDTQVKKIFNGRGEAVITKHEMLDYPIAWITKDPETDTLFINLFNVLSDNEVKFINCDNEDTRSMFEDITMNFMSTTAFNDEVFIRFRVISLKMTAPNRAFIRYQTL